MARPLPSRNRVSVRGVLSRDPEIRTFDSGATLTNLLIRVSGPEGRATSVPVSVWDGVAGEIEGATAGTTVEVEGSLLTRFWAGPAGKRSRLEVVAASCRVR